MTQILAAVYRDGHLVLETPVDWPEGQKVYLTATVDPATLVAPGNSDEERDDPEAIQARLRAFDEIEPLQMTEAEFAEWETAREEFRRVSREAVRKEMGL